MSTGARWREPVIAAAVFAVITAAFFFPVLFEDKSLSVIAGHQSIQFPWAAHPTGYPDGVQSDQANNVYPIQSDLNRTLRGGHFPFWSPFSFAGGPTLATVYGGGFYPPRLLTTFFLAPIQIHDLMLLLHVWLAGLATYALVRALGGSRAAGLLAGVAWMFCPAWFGLAILEGAAVVAALLPLCLWLMYLAVTRRSLALAVACGVALAFFVLGASVQPAVFCFAIVCLWGLVPGVRAATDLRSIVTVAVTNLRYVLIAGALGLALAAFVVLPATGEVGDSARTAVPYATMLQQDIGLGDLAHIIDPVRPWPVTGDNVWSLTFIGIPAALLALIGFFTRRPGSGLARWLVVIFALAMAGTPLTRVAYAVVPGFAYLSPLGRLLPFMSFGIVLLAALGLDRAREMAEARLTRTSRTAGALIALSVVLIAIEGWQVAHFSKSVNPPFQPRAAADLYPQTPLIDALHRQDASLHSAGNIERIVPVRRGGPADPFTPPPFVGETPRLFSIENIGGYMNVVPTRSRALSLMISGVPSDQALQATVGAYDAFFYSKTLRYDLLERTGINAIVTGPQENTDPALRSAAATLGAQTVYAGEDGTVLTLPKALPRAFVVTGSEVAGSTTQALARFAAPKFPFRTTVLLDGPGATRTPAVAGGHSTARVVPVGDDDARVDVDSSTGGWLVLLDSYDQGWSATVNGRTTPIVRGDFAYRAVRVPKGHSVVQMHYATPGLIPGIVITLLGMLAAGALLVVALLRRRRVSAAR